MPLRNRDCWVQALKLLQAEIADLNGKEFVVGLTLSQEQRSESMIILQSNN